MDPENPLAYTLYWQADSARADPLTWPQGLCQAVCQVLHDGAPGHTVQGVQSLPFTPAAYMHKQAGPLISVAMRRTKCHGAGFCTEGGRTI